MKLVHNTEYVSFKKAKNLVQKLEIKTSVKYNELHKAGKLPNLPKKPDSTYKRLKK